jgi:PAS domain S-box-containing protein
MSVQGLRIGESATAMSGKLRQSSNGSSAGAGGQAQAAEQSSAVPEWRYRLLFEHNLAGVYRTTLEGRILDCNESLAAMLGYASREEVMALRAQDLYLKTTDREAFLRRLRKTGVLTNSELCLKRKDGTPIYILENVSLVPDASGELTIIQGTAVDITERKHAEEALLESEQHYRVLVDDLRSLAQHLQTVRDEERARIARELHDELGQALTALGMDLHWLRGRTYRDDKATEARLASMSHLLSTTIQAVRRICADLRPMALDDLGLTAAIEWHARQFESRTGIRCRVSLPARMPDVPREQATAVFRILQESLTNVARHAGARQVSVNLKVRADDLVLKVQDDGRGITKRQVHDSRSLGLAGMRERALRWEGQLTITGVAGKGTTVLLRMPLECSGEAES